MDDVEHMAEPGAGGNGPFDHGTQSLGGLRGRPRRTTPLVGPPFAGATAPPGGPHAEVTALAAASEDAPGRHLYITLEPCAHHGRTPPCTDAIIAAGVPGWSWASRTPIPWWPGGASRRCARPASRSTVGVAADEVAEQLAPYLKHRTTGRPWVVLKMAARLDGRTAAPDGTSRWITGEAARQDVHRLRALSDAMLVGAGTVRADDPELDRPARAPGRTGTSPSGSCSGKAPAGAKVQPALELSRRSGRRARPSWDARRAPAPGGGRGHRGARVSRRRPGRPLRPVPGAGAFRG